MRLTPLQSTLATLSAIALGGAVAYRVTKKKVLRRCRMVVTRDCNNIPLFPEEFCASKAEEICKA